MTNSAKHTMIKRIFKAVLVIYRRMVTSIAFIPAVIALAMLLLALVTIEFDFSSTGKDIKSNLSWLSLKDASTARVICSTIAAGIFSLAVFSFSMVMILLSQAASQMSNRILSKLISNRFQQIVLGFYIGTILYALFLLSTIRDIDSGVYVPAISVYLLICLAIIDIFLFTYFLHYVTQSVKFDEIIYRIFKDTMECMKEECIMEREESSSQPVTEGRPVKAFISGAYEGFDRKGLLSLCKRLNITVSLVQPVRTFMLEGATTLLVVEGHAALPKGFEKELSTVINIGRTHEVTTSYHYGFKQLMEIGIKALSPGINDPGTCMLSLQALGELFAYRLTHSPVSYLKDSEGIIRIWSAERSFDDMFNEYVLPIWDYAKNDRLVQKELIHILKQLQTLGHSDAVNSLMVKCIMKLDSLS